MKLDTQKHSINYHLKLIFFFHLSTVRMKIRTNFAWSHITKVSQNLYDIKRISHSFNRNLIIVKSLFVQVMNWHILQWNRKKMNIDLHPSWAKTQNLIMSWNERISIRCSSILNSNMALLMIYEPEMGKRLHATKLCP